MDSPHLLSLAERVEAASGRCAYLDAAIEVIVRPEIFRKDELVSYGRAYLTGGLNRADWRYLSEIGVRQYTGSIDAAMTMVPEGAAWTLVDPANADGHRSVFGHASRCHATVEGSPNARDYAATPALSLCVAALKARANAA